MRDGDGEDFVGEEICTEASNGCMSFRLSDDWSMFVQESCHYRIVFRHEIIIFGWRIEENGGRFKVEVESVKIFGAKMTYTSG